MIAKETILHLLSECARLGVTPSAFYKAIPKAAVKDWPPSERKRLRYFMSKGWGKQRISTAMGKSRSSVERAMLREKKRQKNMVDKPVRRAVPLKADLAALMTQGLVNGERMGV